MKNYIGIVRDHSGSMSSLKGPATRDYNDMVTAVRDAAIQHYLDTIVSVIECGVGNGEVHRAAVNSSVTFLRPLEERDYKTEGQTPLWDSVGELIEIFQQVPDKDDPGVSFLLNVITDGGENYSRRYSSASLAALIKKHQATDRWTFTFRVPRGHSSQLSYLGIPPGNIMEWEQTQRGMEQATIRTQNAFRAYYAGRASGQSATGKFYADLSQVTTGEVKRTLKDISSEVTVIPVGQKDDGEWIQHFIERRLRGETYLKGAGFYQLSKPETIQDHKRVMIRDKKSGAVYEGYAARQMLGLPDTGAVRMRPGDHGNYDLFIQSTSYNRHLVAGTSVVYWKGFMRAAA